MMTPEELPRVEGIITLVMSFFVGSIASTVLEAINQIGSMANGSILAVFALGLLRIHKRQWHDRAYHQVLVNASLWAFAPLVSWLWWNVVSFCVTFVIGWGMGLVAAPRVTCLGIHRIYEWQTNSLTNTPTEPISIGVNTRPLWLHGF